MNAIDPLPPIREQFTSLTQADAAGVPSVIAAQERLSEANARQAALIAEYRRVEIGIENNAARIAKLDDQIKLIDYDREELAVAMVLCESVDDIDQREQVRRSDLVRQRDLLAMAMTPLKEILENTCRKIEQAGSTAGHAQRAFEQAWDAERLRIAERRHEHAR